MVRETDGLFSKCERSFRKCVEGDLRFFLLGKDNGGVEGAGNEVSWIMRYFFCLMGDTKNT